MQCSCLSLDDCISTVLEHVGSVLFVFLVHCELVEKQAHVGAEGA